MRRVLTILTAAVLSLASLAIGVLTADLPFWQRALQLPLAADAIYLPVAPIGAAPGPLEVHELAADAPARAGLEAAAASARAGGSRALLVMHGQRLVLERYFGAEDPATPLPMGLIARPLTAMAAGLAQADGRIASLDAPVSRWLPEWDDEARGRVTLRQLLEETSGLESGGDIRGLPYASPWGDPARLPRFATSRGVRLLLGNDFERSALGFGLDHEPGGFHNTSPANTQLVAVILERVTGMPFEKFVDERLWRPLGAGPAQLTLDRRSGMPAAHCCWRASARDALRVLNLLASDGVHVTGARVLPAGWAREMARASRVSPETGMQLTRGTLDGLEVLGGADALGSAFWVFPERGLVILNITGPDGRSDPALPALVVGALAPTGTQ